MTQSAPLPGSVFRFGAEVDKVFNPTKAKALTSFQTHQGVETSTFGPSRRSGCAAAEPYPPRRSAQHNQILNLISTML